MNLAPRRRRRLRASGHPRPRQGGTPPAINPDCRHGSRTGAASHLSSTIC